MIVARRADVGCAMPKALMLLFAEDGSDDEEIASVMEAGPVLLKLVLRHLHRKEVDSQ